MNRQRHHHTIPLILRALVVLRAVSCSQGSKDSGLTVEQIYYNDSLVQAAMDIDYNHALLVVDSI